MTVDILPIGSSVRLVSVASLSGLLDLNPDRTLTHLRRLRIPVVRFGGGRDFFDLWSLESTLRLLLMPGGPGYPRPTGSSLRNAAGSDESVRDVTALLDEIGQYYTDKTREALIRRCEKLAKKLTKLEQTKIKP